MRGEVDEQVREERTQDVLPTILIRNPEDEVGHHLDNLRAQEVCGVLLL